MSTTTIPWQIVRHEALVVKGSRCAEYEREDYLQDVSIRMMLARPYDPTRAPPQVYVRVIARTVLRDWMRRHGRRARLCTIVSIAHLEDVAA